MDKQLEALNQRQLSTKKPVVDKEKTHYEWEDTSLLPLLCEGIPRIYPRRVSKEDQEAEDRAIRMVNELIANENELMDYSKFEEGLEALMSSNKGYISNRLESLRPSLIDDAKTRKGILIYGEGGIGKTYFLYELAQQLKGKRSSHAIAFNQEGIIKLSELDLQSYIASHPNGFTLIIDACNELDDNSFALALNLISEALKNDRANAVVTTRSESPTSRIEELRQILPASIEFQGVNPGLAFSALAECSDEVIVQFQDMLFSRNPRNLNAMLSMIREFRPNEDGFNATTQRTALVERCIKSSLSKQRWIQTKRLCRFLLDSDSIGFSKNDASRILGDESDLYLMSMIEQGFIECYDYGEEEPRYFYSSESQIRYVIARCLNNDFDKINNCGFDENELIDNIAKLVVKRSSHSNDHEMIQVAIDRYIDRGPLFLAKLLDNLKKCGLYLDWERLFSQTIFPLDWDFNGFVAAYEVEVDWAFLHFSGILNTPFNLRNFTNAFFLANESLVDSFFIKKWESWELAPIISRLQNLSYFVSRTQRVPSAAATEWVWFSIWCSFSSDMTLRALSQRLLFSLCDSSSDALREAIDAWKIVKDVFARRAITKAISHLDNETRRAKIIQQFIDNAVREGNVTDSIVIANICRASDGRITPIDFNSKNIYLELEDFQPTEDDLKAFKHQADMIDLVHKNFFPFDIYKMQKGYIDFGYFSSFISTPTQMIKSWNDSLRELLNCQPGGECKGYLKQIEDFQGFLPVEFKVEKLDQRKLMNCIVFLTNKWLEYYGGNLQELLGKFQPLNPYRDTYLTPNMKPFDLASHELLGSLATNYYVDEIVLDEASLQNCGFSQYDEQAYNEPGIIHACVPSSNIITDSAKPKLERRIVSPEDKDRSWFDDTDEAYSEILNMIADIRVGKIEWQPIALSAKHRVRVDNDLIYSNELIISIAFNTNQHINGGHDDRNLTIEHESFKGNIRDYKMEHGSLCKILDAPDEHCTVTERNQILLPPPSLVRKLNLTFDPRTACFLDASTSEIVIACDGAPGSYYEEPIHNLILMRKVDYDNLIKNESITFFAFTERFHKEDGYRNECDRHWEFLPDGTLIADYPNGGGVQSSVTPDSCKDCFFSSTQQLKRQEENGIETVDPDWLRDIDELIDKYR